MMNTPTPAHTPAMDALRAFLDASGGKVLGRRQHELFESLYIAARTEQRAITLAN